MSERHACRLLGQWRGTQRYEPMVRTDEEALTQAIIALASEYGRYGYRRITALLREAGWQVGKDRVQCIWRREGLKVPQKQRRRGRLWLNDGAGKFVDVAQAVGVNDTYDGRAVAFADLWNRGVLDVVVANQKGPLLVYKNTVTPENEWIEFDLEGTASNRSAIGAQVTLYWNGQQQVQEVSGGSGFAAENQRRLHFGLGKYPQIEKVVIRWPSGKLQTIDKPAAGQLHKIKEPA